MVGHSGYLRNTVFSDNEKYLATSATDSLIIIWSLGEPSVKQERSLRTESPVTSMVFCGQDSLICSREDGRIMLWIIDENVSTILYESGNDKPLCLVLNSKTKDLLAGCSNGILLSFDLTGQPAGQPSRYTVHTAGIDRIVLSPDFSLLATSSRDKTIKFYNYHLYFDQANTVGGAVTIKNLNLRVRSIIFTDDNKLVAGLSDSSIRVWETSSGKLATLICGLVKRDMTIDEWNTMVGKEVTYRRTCNENQ